MCKTIRNTCVVWLWLLLTVSAAYAAEADDGSEVNVRQIVLTHIGDAYEWSVARWGDTELIIPLPVIVRSEKSGWHIFSSERLRDGGKPYGLYISQEGKYEGKIVENNSSGTQTRPLDISITKTVFALLFNSTLLLALILSTAACYRKKGKRDKAPKGFIGLMEMCVMMIYNDIIRTCVGKEHKRFAPYLLTVFFFIFLNNLMGLIPLFPGGANVTGNIAVTLVLALCTFLAVNLSGSKSYWKEILWPEVPVWLKAPIPLMPLVELVGVFTKPFALMIRLFANMLAGHAGIVALTCLIFVTVKMGAAVNGSLTVVSLLFGLFMNALELLIAFVQAYVFTILSAIFIGLSQQAKETPESVRQ